MRVRIVGFCAAVVLAIGGMAGAGCKSKECTRMLACCRALEGMEGVGGACGPKSRAVGDPKTCRTILKTARMMFEERSAELPKPCRKSPEK